MGLLADRQSQLLIDGELESGSGGTFPTVNPATEEVLGVAADATAEDMGRAIGAARRAFDDTDWSTDTELRVRCIRQLQQALRDNADELRELAIAEVGAPRMLTAMAQFDGPVEDLSFCADTAESYQWTTDLGIAAPMGIKTHRTIAREAIGVVGAITPWNFPNQINLAKIGPALAAGNTVVLKPAPDTPWSAAVLGELIRDHTDIPAGVVNVVTSADHAVGALLSKDPRVDMVSFTGSTRTGRAVMADGSATLKKVFLELGGKSAFLVLDDADLAGACSMSAFTASMHAGTGLRDHHPPRGAAGPLRRSRRGGGGDHGRSQAGRPDRRGNHLRTGDLGSPARPDSGISGLGDRGGWTVRLRRRTSRRPGHRVLHRADGHRRP